MIRDDNCISFNRDLASIYDETRPFLPKFGDSLALSAVCSRLEEHFGHARPEIVLMDAGAGTGRLSLRIAALYERMCVERNLKRNLRIVCVDRSSEMLEVLKSNLRSGALGTRALKNVSVEPLEADLRDLAERGQEYDAVLAHWVFHVIVDWHTAVLSLDSVLREDGLLFFGEEKSPLYAVIDGDLAVLPANEPISQLWESYHTHRNEALLQAVHSPVSQPRARVGSLVVDERVPRLFRALGWQPPIEFPQYDVLCYHFTFEQVIKTIVGRRAFSNMRIEKNEAVSASNYSSIANRLLYEYRFQLTAPWDFEGTFRIRHTTRAALHERKPERILLDIARDTAARRWLARVDKSYHADTVLARLLDAAWDRLHRRGDQRRPLIGTELSDRMSTEGMLFTTTLNGKTHFRSLFGDSGTSWAVGETAWNGLTELIETQDPYVIWFDPKPDAIQCRRSIEDTWYGNASIYPNLHVLVVSRGVRAALTRCIIRSQGSTDIDAHTSTARLAAQLRANRGALRSFVKEALGCGILSFSDVATHSLFLLSVARLAAEREIKGVYVFPALADWSDRSRLVRGCLLGVSEPLRGDTVDFLSQFGEILCADWDTVPSEKIGVAEANKRPLDSIQPKKSLDTVRAPILVLTAAQYEAEAVLQSAGISDLDLRSFFYNDLPVTDLGFGEIPIWLIRTGKGSSGAQGSTVTLMQAVNQAKPWAVIMVGFAYGLKEDAHKIGDVLVSEEVVDCDPERVGEGELRPRGSRIPANPELVQIFRTFGANWQHNRSQEERPNVHFGLMLSGNKLVDSQDYRENLRRQFKDAIGGEMEGAGLSAVGLESRVRWIIIKAICDWGVNKSSNPNRDYYQRVAASNAADYLFSVLLHDEVLKKFKGPLNS